ncbi:hypothetical protein E2C01_060024 [Portunus trituberculatus]|uniref:Uncharacterized protein n=1 Tax=Portunus trituberculatus TaxID=210409 RepID=A0A5B7H7F4_PORTR|nr:hypothetical protein [Portunus trituberculatus]
MQAEHIPLVHLRGLHVAAASQCCYAIHLTLGQNGGQVFISGGVSAAPHCQERCVGCPAYACQIGAPTRGLTLIGNKQSRLV